MRIQRFSPKNPYPKSNLALRHNPGLVRRNASVPDTIRVVESAVEFGSGVGVVLLGLVLVICRIPLRIKYAGLAALGLSAAFFSWFGRSPMLFGAFITQTALIIWVSVLAVARNGVQFLAQMQTERWFARLSQGLRAAKPRVMLVEGDGHRIRAVWDNICLGRPDILRNFVDELRKNPQAKEATEFYLERFIDETTTELKNRIARSFQDFFQTSYLSRLVSRKFQPRLVSNVTVTHDEGGMRFSLGVEVVGVEVLLGRTVEANENPIEVFQDNETAIRNATQRCSEELRFFMLSVYATHEPA